MVRGRWEGSVRRGEEGSGAGDGGCFGSCGCCAGGGGDGEATGEVALRFSPFDESVVGSVVVVVVVMVMVVGSVLLLASIGSGGVLRPATSSERAVASVSGLDSNAPTLPACAPAEVSSLPVALKYCSISVIASSSGLCVALKLSRNSMLPLLKPNCPNVFCRSVNEDSSRSMACRTGVS